MGLIRKKNPDGSNSSPSYNKSDDEKVGQTEHVENVEDVEYGHKELDPALARRVVRMFDLMAYNARY